MGEWMDGLKIQMRAQDRRYCIKKKNTSMYKNNSKQPQWNYWELGFTMPNPFKLSKKEVGPTMRELYCCLNVNKKIYQLLADSEFHSFILNSSIFKTDSSFASG